MSNPFTNLLNKLSSPDASRPPKPRRTRTMPADPSSGQASSSSASSTSNRGSPERASVRARSTPRPAVALSNVFRNLTGRNRSASSVGPAGLAISGLEGSEVSLPQPPSRPAEEAESSTPPLSVGDLLGLIAAPTPQSAVHLNALAAVLSANPPPSPASVPRPSTFLPLLAPFLSPSAAADTRLPALRCLSEYISLPSRPPLSPAHRAQAYTLIARRDAVSADELDDISTRLVILRQLMPPDAPPLPILEGVPGVQEAVGSWTDTVSRIRNARAADATDEDDATPLLQALLSFLSSLPSPDIVLVSQLVHSALVADLAQSELPPPPDEPSLPASPVSPPATRRRGSHPLLPLPTTTTTPSTPRTPVTPTPPRPPTSVPPTPLPRRQSESGPSALLSPPPPPPPPTALLPTLHALPLSYLLPLLAAPAPPAALPHLLTALLPLLAFPPSRPLPALPSLTADVEDPPSPGWTAIRALLTRGATGVRVVRFVRQLLARVPAPASPPAERAAYLGALRALRLALRHAASERLARAALSDAIALDYGHAGPALSGDSNRLLDRVGPGIAAVLDGLELWRYGKEVRLALGAGWEEAAGEALGMVRDWVEENEGVERVRWDGAVGVAEMVGEACAWVREARDEAGNSVILDFSASSAPPTDASTFQTQLTALLTRILAVLSPEPYAPPQGLYKNLLPPLLPSVLSLAPNLSPASAALVISHYETEHLLLPVSPHWIDNIRALMDAFLAPSPSPSPAREQAARVILHTTFRALLDLPPYLADLLALLLPRVEGLLPTEPSPAVARLALDFLEECVVAGAEAERARALICKIARECGCGRHGQGEYFDQNGAGQGGAETPAPSTAPRAPPFMGLIRNVLGGGGWEPQLREETPTPVSSPQRVVSQPASPSIPTTGTMAQPQPADDDDAPPQPHAATCKSTAAVLTLISLFTHLAFSPPSALDVAAAQSILVFQDILALLAPGEAAASCTRARLAALQWLVRLRADRDHRLFVLTQQPLEDEVGAFAALVGRTKESASAMAARHAKAVEEEMQAEQEDLARRRSMGPMPPTTMRGRESRAVSRSRERRDRSSRSRDRSRQTQTGSVEPPPPPPIWMLPEELPFEVDVGTRPSEGMTTYVPQDPDDHRDVARQWLPISAYVGALLELLHRETDWELLAYVLCFLPSQLANKHLFCGPRTRRVIARLVDAVRANVMSAAVGERIRLPDALKPADVHGLAYQTLTVLISYRPLLERGEMDALVDAFQLGLTRDATTAKPCLQALAVAAFELQESMTRALSKILAKLTQIMSVSAMSVHIIELLCVIGSIPALYANFTEEEYRRVFGVAVQYIQYHNDAKAIEAGLSYALSQHILGLAYYSIYVWFLALPLAQRQKYVPYIIRQLKLASDNKGGEDEPTEVCLDWLVRYTYANADPRAHKSFLNDIVMTPSPGDRDGAISEMSWLVGHSIITVRTLEKRGWTEIISRRPSGNTQVFCKLENVPTTGPGEYSPDMRSDVAGLMADRDLDVVGEPVTDAPDVPGTEDSLDLASDLARESAQRSAEEALAIFNLPLQGGMRALDPLTGYVWSGSTPSQRRKTVSVYPSFFPMVLSPVPSVTERTSHFQRIPPNNWSDTTIRNIDWTPVIDCHHIGILYAAPGQTTEQEILSNRHGSPAYTSFLRGLGRLIRLRGQKDIYHGDLDIVEDLDGEYAYAWWDDIAQILYHTATLMPNKEGDLKYFVSKKRHLGNDHVRIVWNESGSPYRFDTLATAYQFVNVVIEPHSAGTVGAYSDSPHEHEYFKVTVQRAENMPEFGPIGQFKVISMQYLPVLVRQISLLADFFAKVFEHTRRDTEKVEFITAWRRRLQNIKKVNTPAPTWQLVPPPEPPVEDGETDFTTDFRLPESQLKKT